MKIDLQSMPVEKLYDQIVTLKDDLRVGRGATVDELLFVEFMSPEYRPDDVAKAIESLIQYAWSKGDDETLHFMALAANRLAQRAPEKSIDVRWITNTLKSATLNQFSERTLGLAALALIVARSKDDTNGLWEHLINQFRQRDIEAGKSYASRDLAYSVLLGKILHDGHPNLGDFLWMIESFANGDIPFGAELFTLLRAYLVKNLSNPDVRDAVQSLQSISHCALKLSQIEDASNRFETVRNAVERALKKTADETAPSHKAKVVYMNAYKDSRRELSTALPSSLVRSTQ